MKIAFFEVFDVVYGGKKKIFEGDFSGHEVSYFNEKLDSGNVGLVGDAEIISIFTSSAIDKDIIDSLPKLKFINTGTTGFDHIDTKYCEEKGIKVSNVPAYGSDTVAEFTFALLLALSRKILEANNQLRLKDDFDYRGFQGFDLKGKTIGVVGTGKIGRNVIRIAKGFGMNVIACDSFEDNALESEMGFPYKSFEEIISLSDIITLHVPMRKENYHLINKENIAKMKKGVYVINTARGGLIDTDALVWGLKEGIIAGAGLDVLEGEGELKEEVKALNASSANQVKDYKDLYKTLLEDHMLIDMPNVIVTPHIAFFSEEALENIIKTTMENIKGFIAGSPVNLVK